MTPSTNSSSSTSLPATSEKPDLRYVKALAKLMTEANLTSITLGPLTLTREAKPKDQRETFKAEPMQSQNQQTKPLSQSQRLEETLRNLEENA